MNFYFSNIFVFINAFHFLSVMDLKFLFYKMYHFCLIHSVCLFCLLYIYFVTYSTIFFYFYILQKRKRKKDDDTLSVRSLDTSYQASLFLFIYLFYFIFFNSLFSDY